VPSTTIYDAHIDKIGPQKIKSFEYFSLYKLLPNSEPIYLSVNGLISGASSIEVGQTRFEFKESYSKKDIAKDRYELYHVTDQGELISTNLLLGKESFQGNDLLRLNNLTLLVDPENTTLKLLLNGTVFYSISFAEGKQNAGASHIRFRSGIETSKIYQVLVGTENPYFEDLDNDGFDDRIREISSLETNSLDDMSKLDTYIEYSKSNGPRESMLALPSPDKS